jgi:hypothetical protein
LHRSVTSVGRTRTRSRGAGCARAHLRRDCPTG